jgi:hypothetical protein
MPLEELEAVCEKSCGDSCKNTTFAPDADEELDSVIAAPNRAVKSCRRTAEASNSGNTRAKRKKAVNNTGTEPIILGQGIKMHRSSLLSTLATAKLLPDALLKLPTTTIIR